MMTSVYWLIAFAVLVAVEMASMALTTIWFAGGALASFFLSLFMPEAVRLQLAVFVIVSFILLFFTRPLAKRLLGGRTVRTNAESLIGKKARVTAAVDNEQGTAVVGGQEWTARALEEGKTYQPGEQVWIREIRGVKLIVSGQQGDAPDGS